MSDVRWPPNAAHCWNNFLKRARTLILFCPFALLPFCPFARTLIPFCPFALLPFCPFAVLSFCQNINSLLSFCSATYKQAIWGQLLTESAIKTSLIPPHKKSQHHPLTLTSTKVIGYGAYFEDARERNQRKYSARSYGILFPCPNETDFAESKIFQDVTLPAHWKTFWHDFGFLILGSNSIFWPIWELSWSLCGGKCRENGGTGPELQNVIFSKTFKPISPLRKA